MCIFFIHVKIMHLLHLLAMASNLEAMASNLEAMASNLIAMASLIAIRKIHFICSPFAQDAEKNAFRH